MRVTSSSFPQSLIYQLQSLTETMNTLQEQTATGQRISSVSDDPAAAVRVLSYKSERSQIEQYDSNAERAENIINATTSELQNLLDVSSRANEIISLASDVEGDTALEAYGTEINALLEQALVNANANFNDEPLFGGTTANVRPFTAERDADGNIIAITYEGSTTTASFSVADGSEISPYSSYESNLEIADFLNNLVALRDSLNAADTEAVKDLGTTMQESEDELITMLSGQGALLSRIEVERSQNSARYADLAEQISSDADVDLAQAIVQLSQNQNAYQAALMSASKVLTSSLLDYL